MGLCGWTLKGPRRNIGHRKIYWMIADDTSNGHPQKDNCLFVDWVILSPARKDDGRKVLPQ